MKAGFGLEPLAGEAGLDGDSGGGANAAEGEVAGGPDYGSRGVRREHGSADTVSAQVADCHAFDHRHGFPDVPDVFADQRAES